jgi:hypothetical protein
MGMFAQNFAKATPGAGGGLWYKDGDYPLIQIDHLKLIDSKNPQHNGAEKLIIVTDILQSKVAERPAGMRGLSHVLNSQHAGAARDAKEFCIAVFPGVDHSEWDKDGEESPMHPKNPRGLVHDVTQLARGRLVSLTVFTKISEKSKKPFSVHRYTAVSDAIQEQADELRAAAGLPPMTASA